MIKGVWHSEIIENQGLSCTVGGAQNVLFPMNNNWVISIKITNIVNLWLSNPT